ncbi:hypothetical protein AB0K18_50035, partial [Nonomuraea sp. NPDC049421]
MTAIRIPGPVAGLPFDVDGDVVVSGARAHARHPHPRPRRLHRTRVWAADWDSEGIVYTLDGRTVFTISKDQVEQTRGPWIFDHPFYIILNLAVGGDWPG